jgi:glycosyltransferase involved in cell wall biosynthesis
MNIAIIAPVLRKISSDNLYGGIERIIASLAIGAAEFGHNVTLYAPSGTDLKHKNLNIRFTTDQDITKTPDGTKKYETELFNRIVNEQEDFDIIHTHIEPIVAQIENDNYYSKIKKQLIVTMHNQTYIDKNIEYYKTNKILGDNISYVFISHNQAKPLNFLPRQTVIYNGINIDEISFNANPNYNQLAFLGRITPEKGIDQAIKIAIKSNKKLLIAAAIDKSQQDFFDTVIEPQLNNEDIIYLGEVTNAEKNELLRSSAALLFPIQWNEPFGLVMVEAMAAGTPVIAPNIGSVSEIIQDNKTGFIISNISDIDEYSSKISRIEELDRSYCRKIAENKFQDDIMIKKYLDYYNNVISPI